MKGGWFGFPPEVLGGFSSRISNEVKE